MTSRSIPDIQIVPVRSQTADLTRLPSINPAIGQLADLRTLRVEEFLMAAFLGQTFSIG